MENLKNFLIKYDVDFAALTEQSMDLRMITTDQTFWAQTRAWFEYRRLQIAQNRCSQATSKFQVGGVISMVMNEMGHRVIEMDQDERKLGRWSSVRTRGKNSLFTTIVTAYCPCISFGAGSAYTQQLAHLQEIGIQSDPRHAFWNDLEQLITRSIESGDQIILMGDWNSEFSEVRTWMESLGLVELICEKHGYDPPATHQRSKDSPLDAIFGTSNFRATKAGYLDFGQLLSDHRGLYMDIPIAAICGYNMPQIISPTARRLKSNDPRCRDRYNKDLRSQFQQEDLFQRMDTVHDRTTYPLSEELQLEYEQIDKISSKMMYKAEKNCRKLKAGATKWSPAYQETCDTIYLWHLVLEEGRGANNKKMIVRLKKKLKIKDTKVSIAVATAKFKEAHEDRKVCKAQDCFLHREYRDRLAAARAAEGKGTAASHLKRMNKDEDQRQLFRKIKFHEGKLGKTSTTHITVTSKYGETIELTKQGEIEAALLEVNEAKYHQTESGGSQFLTGTLLNDVGPLGLGPCVDQILDGTYEPDSTLSQATKDFLVQMKRLPDCEEDLSPLQTVQEFKRSWELRKEKTSSFNHHMGHYKSCVMDEDLCLFLFQRKEVPLLSGYAPIRHRTCTDLMIMKSSMKRDVMSLRTIGILDTEANQSYKQLGREAMHKALDKGQIADEQFSRVGKSAIEHAINKRFIFDYHRFLRRPFGLLSCDMTACYDRIIHAAATLALLRIGISKAKVASMFSAIQRMIHRIRTAFGDSECTYGGDVFDAMWTMFPMGILQGNGMGPQLWSILSSNIFFILRKKGFSNKFIWSISKELFELVGFAYVDDSDLFQSGGQPEDIVLKMQAALDEWVDLMEVTGGAIAPHKSWWYLIDYRWKRGKWICTNAGTDFTLTAKNDQGSKSELEYLNSDIASKMLGIYMAPDANNVTQIQHMRKQATDWASQLNGSSISKSEAWTALHCTIPMKLKYPGPACTLTRAQCQFVMAPVNKIGLTRSGITSTLPSPFRVGPITSGGAGVLDLYTDTRAGTLTYLIDQIWRQTSSGSLANGIIENLVIEAGVTGLLWDYSFSILKQWISTDTLLLHTWEFAFTAGLTLNLHHAQIPLTRKWDQPLMIAFSKSWTGRDIKALNKVRQYHEVTTIADIATADGREINPFFLKSIKSSARRNTFQWPEKHEIKPGDLAIWRKALKSLCALELKLNTPLGPWAMQQANWTQDWDWFSTATTDILYHQDKQGNWTEYPLKEGTRRTKYFHNAPRPLNQTPSAITDRISVKIHSQTITVWSKCTRTDNSAVTFPTTCLTSSMDIKRYLQRADNEPWISEHFESSVSITTLLQDFKEGTALAVSDGSYYEEFKVGAAAWKIQSKDGTEFISGGGVIPGHPDAQSSFRSELGGLVGLGMGAMALAIATSSSPSLDLGCDGSSALLRNNLSSLRVSCSMTDYDVISILSRIWELSPVQPNAIEVRGHQDDLGRELTVMEIMNVEMDHMAKTIALEVITNGTPVPASIISTRSMQVLVINDRTVHSKLRKSIYESITTSNLRQYMVKKGIIREEDLQHISWIAFARARSEVAPKMQIFVTKVLSNTLPVGLVMTRRQHRWSSKCPRCGQMGESTGHVLQCWDKGALSTWDSNMITLSAWMTKVHTEPSLSLAITDILKMWQKRPSQVQSTLEATAIPSQAEELRHQDNIGWMQFMQGFIHEDLIRLQSTYYTEIHSQRTGKRWATNLIKKLWEIMHSMWKHRSSILHESDIINSLSGQEFLVNSIKQEHARGRERLHSLITPYFAIPLDTLLLKTSPKNQRKWFQLIKAARERTGTDIQDEFSTNITLRKWIGLKDIAF